MADRRRAISGWAATALLAGLVLAAGWLWTRTAPPRRPAAAEPPAVAAAPPATARGATGGGPGTPGPASPDALPRDESAGDDPLEAMDASAAAWARVDLDAVRAAMPNNLYWTMSMPTRDAAVLRERERIREGWNREYGKVLSNTATEQEVRDYYAHRQRLSADSVEFTSYLLDHYGDVLPERDVGLLELARELHLARLEELPRNLADALERREAHARAREVWRAEQALFDAPAPPGAEGSEPASAAPAAPGDRPTP